VRTCQEAEITTFVISTETVWYTILLTKYRVVCDAGAAGDMGSIPESGRFPGGGHGSPLQYSCLENPKDRGAWRAIVHRVTKS